MKTRCGKIGKIELLVLGTASRNGNTRDILTDNEWLTSGYNLKGREVIGKDEEEEEEEERHNGDRGEQEVWKS